MITVLFWFNNFYFRLVTLSCVVFYEYILKIYYKIEQNVPRSQYERNFIANTWYFQAIILFFINYGTTDTNINVRAAYRGTSDLIGVSYLQSTVIFQITKWGIEILTICFFYLRLISHEFSDNLSNQTCKSFAFTTMKTFQPYCKN